LKLVDGKVGLILRDQRVAETAQRAGVFLVDRQRPAKRLGRLAANAAGRQRLAQADKRLDRLGVGILSALVKSRGGRVFAALPARFPRPHQGRDNFLVGDTAFALGFASVPSGASHQTAHQECGNRKTKGCVNIPKFHGANLQHL